VYHIQKTIQLHTRKYVYKRCYDKHGRYTVTCVHVLVNLEHTNSQHGKMQCFLMVQQVAYISVPAVYKRSWLFYYTFGRRYY
jgi:hypothetical protein